jgi:hypothetical protein
VLIPKLRRVPSITWTVIALVILAALPLGPIRAVARYLLVGYVPGLAIWKFLRPNASSIVDLVLYPSLLSILPFAWIALACVALGVDLRVAGLITIAVFLAIGFSRGWNVRVEERKDDRLAIGLGILLVVFLLVIPFAANSFQAVAWDAPLHAAIASRILSGVVPPDSPMMAGQPANYYWLYHFYSAALMRLTGLSVYQVFAVLNLHALLLFVLAGYRVASRLTESVFGRFSAVWMLVFGLNAFGWIIFLASGSASPDKWYSLVAPFAMVKGYSPSLGSLIHEFLDGFPFAVSFAFDIAWLDVLLARVNGERGGALVTGGLILATIFYLHPLSAVFLIAASFAAVIVFSLIRRDNKREAVRLLFDLTAMTVAAALVTAPYAWDILHGKTGTPLSVALSPSYLKSQAYSMLAAVGLVGLLALPGLWLGFRDRQRATIVLALFAGAIAVAALITHVALEAEYKLIYLLAFGLAPLVAGAWNFWNRTLATRTIFILALAISAPTNALTSYCFATKPPRESRDPTRFRLFDWIRDQTPGNAILVEYPWWEKYQTSDSAFLYLDRFWFDIGVYADRRQLIGYGAPMLEQWGYRDIGLRQALAAKLTKGDALAPDDVAYLIRLRAPIIVVTNASVVGNEGFDRAIYSKIYEDGDLRAYRVLLPES